MSVVKDESSLTFVGPTMVEVLGDSPLEEVGSSRSPYAIFNVAYQPDVYVIEHRGDVLRALSHFKQYGYANDLVEALNSRADVTIHQYFGEHKMAGLTFVHVYDDLSDPRIKPAHTLSIREDAAYEIPAEDYKIWSISERTDEGRQSALLLYSTGETE